MKNNNLSSSFKKFIGNKNTVTILGVLLCIVILYIGYNYRINQKTKLVRVPYAKETINPKTLITSDMIGYMEVPTSFLAGSYYGNASDIEGKYSSYNSIIVEGSLFYRDLVIKESELPDSMFGDIPKGYIVAQLNVNISSTYANSIMPGNIVNIYFKALNDEGNKAYFGKFIENVEVLAIKDANGNNVFDASDEVRTPAYMYIALPEEYFNLVGKVNKIPSNSMEFLIVPNTIELTEKDSVQLSSEDIKTLIEQKSIMIDSNNITE